MSNFVMKVSLHLLGWIKLAPKFQHLLQFPRTFKVHANPVAWFSYSLCPSADWVEQQILDWLRNDCIGCAFTRATPASLCIQLLLLAPCSSWLCEMSLAARSKDGRLYLQASLEVKIIKTWQCNDYHLIAKSPLFRSPTSSLWLSLCYVV